MSIMDGSGMKAAIVAALLLGGAPAAAATKRIYIAPDDHTDYMWSADEAFYANYFVNGLDYYLDQIDATDASPSSSQARWNADGTQWLAAYEAAKPGAPFDRLMGRVADGHIGVPMNGLVEVHGGTPMEAVLRDLYYAGRLERRYGIKFELAIAMEDQTFPYGLSGLWAGAGVKYSWKGVCACATQVSDSGNRLNDIYWLTAADGSRILMKWNSLQAQLPSAVDRNQGPGGYAEARYPREVIPLVSSDPAFRARYPYDTIGVFGQGWDNADYYIPLSDTTNSFPAVAASLSDASRDIIVSNMRDFFVDFAGRYGATLPTETTVSYGNEWEVSAAAFAAKSARLKRAVEKLRAAEAMATVVSLSDPSFTASRTAARDAAFRAMGLFFEHDLNGSGPCCTADQRVAYQERQVIAVETYVEALHADAASALGGLVPAAAGTTRVYVFNPLGWLRTDVAEAARPGSVGATVTDVSTGKAVAAELIGSGASRRLRFEAVGVPSLGYKVFEIRDGTPSAGASASYIAGVLTSSRYKLRLAGNGAITSLQDRLSASRELVRVSDGLAINDFGPGTGTVSVERIGPVSATLRADITSPLARTVRVTVFKSVPRLEIEDSIDQGFDATQTISFGLNLDAPSVRHEEVGAVIRAKLAPEGDYSARSQNAIYQWLTLNHFTDMSAGDNSYGVTLSNTDAYYMRLGNSDFHTLDTATPRIDVLAGGRVNTVSDVANQGGDTAFRYRFALRPHAAYSQVTAMKTALEHANPLVTGTVSGGAGAPLPATNWALVKLTSANQLIWAVKPAEEGIAQGIIVRVWNQTPAATTFKAAIGLPYTLRSTTRTSSIETDLASQAAAATVAANQIATYRLRTN